MLRLALLGLIVTWCVSLVRVVRAWRAPALAPVRSLGTKPRNRAAA